MTENGVGPAGQLLHATSSSGACGPAARSCRAAAGSAAATTAGGTPPVAQARRTAALGGKFVLLDHDLWGADGAAISRFPGDNGDWTDYDNFLTRAVQRRPGRRAHRSSGTSGTSRTSPCSGTGPSRSTSSCGGAPTSASAPRSRAMLIVGPELRRRAVDRRLVDAVPGLREGQQRRARHHQLALAARRPGGQRRHGQHHARLARHRAPAAVPDQRVRRVQRAEPGRRRVVHRPAGAGRRGRPARELGRRLATCTTTWPACSPATPAGSTSPRASGGCTTSTPSRPARSCRSPRAATTTPSPPRRPASAKVLVGGGRTTGNVAVNLQRLDTISGIVQNNQVRVVVQSIPYNNGGAVSGPSRCGTAW